MYRHSTILSALNLIFKYVLHLNVFCGLNIMHLCAGIIKFVLACYFLHTLCHVFPLLITTNPISSSRHQLQLTFQATESVQRVIVYSTVFLHHPSEQTTLPLHPRRDAVVHSINRPRHRRCNSTLADAASRIALLHRPTNRPTAERRRPSCIRFHCIEP